MHDWDVTTEEAREIQERLRRRVRAEPLESSVETVAGADVSFSRGSDDLFAAFVVLEVETLEILDVGRGRADAPMPYVPTYLSFREAPALLEAWDDLETEPDLIIFDGQGIAHPRRMGIAAHMGVLLDHPSIGSAKNILCGDYDEPDIEKGSHSDIIYESDVVGSVLRTRTDVNPVFVSIGHRITLEEAREQVLRVSPKFKIPEPIRHAHREVNRIRREVEDD